LKSGLCLELAVGGPLAVFKQILGKYYDVVDINELTSVQMSATYKAESTKDLTCVGIIGDRFQCNMKDLGLLKKYDLIYGHWSLGYLLDTDLSSFMKRCRNALMSDDGTLGLMIIKETICDSNQE
jgi:protein N-terminal methyltransferase